MTRGEAIKILEGAIKKPNTKDGYLGQALSMAINSLSAIENIKAEIETHHMNDLAYDEMSDFERGVLSIIDKHISGKENK